MDNERLMWLRQDIMMNIQLADNKVCSIEANFSGTPGMDELYLEAISPNLDASEAPKGYEIFNAITDEEIEYQCKICREILMKKYEIIDKMIKLVNASLIISAKIIDNERSLAIITESYEQEYADMYMKITGIKLPEDNIGVDENE